MALKNKTPYRSLNLTLNYQYKCYELTVVCHMLREVHDKKQRHVWFTFQFLFFARDARLCEEKYRSCENEAEMSGCGRQSAKI